MSTLSREQSRLAARGIVPPAHPNGMLARAIERRRVMQRRRRLLRSVRRFTG